MLGKTLSVGFQKSFQRIAQFGPQLAVKGSGELAAPQARYGDEGLSSVGFRHAVRVRKARQKPSFVEREVAFGIDSIPVFGRGFLPVRRRISRTVSQKCAGHVEKGRGERLRVDSGTPVPAVVVDGHRYRDGDIAQDGQFILVPIPSVAAHGAFGEYSGPLGP